MIIWVQEFSWKDSGGIFQVPSFLPCSRGLIIKIGILTEAEYDIQIQAALCYDS